MHDHYYDGLAPMNLFTKLQGRAAAGTPIRVGMIGAGKFGSMFLAQAIKLPGIHIVAICDLDVARAQSNLAYIGWPQDRYAATSLDEAHKNHSTFITDNAQLVIETPLIDIIVECTGNPVAAVAHLVAAFAAHKHVISATVEADAFCGPGLAAAAQEAGVIYSMAFGDQPALVCDLVDWARSCGFSVAAAGRGHKWRPEYRFSTPETIWDYWGLSKEQAERGRLNPKMFNAFLDGSKPAIESAAIANATGLQVPVDGLAYPSGGVDDIPNLMRPRADGGRLDHTGMVEVISCLDENGAQIGNDIRKGVWVCIEADTDYIKNCFEEYKVVTDSTGRYMSLYKKWHLIGLELGISVASVGVRGEATGVATCFNADVSAFAKQDLAAGAWLDGEGGFTVYGGVRPAAHSVAKNYLPLGLAHQVKLIKPVKKDQPITLQDVELETTSPAYAMRQKTIAMLGNNIAYTKS
jgi:predicted homoserine dehydrogenase-like protein